MLRLIWTRKKPLNRRNRLRRKVAFGGVSPINRPARRLHPSPVTDALLADRAIWPMMDCLF